MKRLLFIALSILTLTSCNTKNETEGFEIQGNIEGLRLGNVFLYQIKDSTLVVMDSVLLDGKSDFTLTGKISEPQILFLQLEKRDGSNYNDRIAFFAEDTTMTFKTRVKNFAKDAYITGGKNQKYMLEYYNNRKRLDSVFTGIAKHNFLLNSIPNADPRSYDKLDARYLNYLKKRVTYAMNYARLHKDLELAPYILLEEVNEANPIILEEIYNEMPKKIQTSLYGKKLSEFIKLAKANMELTVR